MGLFTTPSKLTALQQEAVVVKQDKKTWNAVRIIRERKQLPWIVK